MDSPFDPGLSPPVPPVPGEREADRMRQLLAAYRTFVGHDLPNQLVFVQASACLLEKSDHPGLDDESKTLLGRIAALSQKMGLQARRLSEVGDLLREPPWGPPLSLAEVAEEVVAGIRWRAEAGEIVFHLPQGGPTLPLAGVLFRKVVAELLANAVAAIGPGHAGRIDVAGEWSAGGGMIRVSDTGIGIAPERIDGLLRPTQMGGLLLVHQVASLWGGRLYIDSAVGRGTTISVMTGACQ
jgi:signal transduction histidine kinase